MTVHTVHLAVGERVWEQIVDSQQTGTELAVGGGAYGAFLLGCVLADTSLLGEVTYRQTHFTAGMYGTGEESFDRSCENLLAQLKEVLRVPWPALASAERAFVAGYLCHLAADETWKRFCWRVMDRLGISRWDGLPVPFGVLMTAYHVRGAALWIDRKGIADALATAEIPAAMRHVPHVSFVRAWAAFKAHSLDGRTAESYLDMLGRMGQSEKEIAAARAEHERYWEEALAFVEREEAIAVLAEEAVARSLEVIPRLWEEYSLETD
jgi:hypothetical protein